MSNKEALDHFGEILMRRVRDESIGDWYMILDGRMKDPGSQEIRSGLEQVGFNDAQLTFLRQLIPKIVDTTLHHLLWTLEQEESIDLSIRLDEGVVPSLRDSSDGLAGELYDWAPRFSREPLEEP